VKNLKKFLGISLLSATIALPACKNDDPEPKPATCESGVFESTINGSVSTGISFNNTLEKAGGKRMDIRATDAQGRQVIVSFIDYSTGREGDGVSTDEYIPFAESYGTENFGTENTCSFTLTEGGISYYFINGTLDITSCDANAKKISGTFSFSEGDQAVTNGSFTDMCYSIIK
jgi:hypothetical protein